MALRRNRLLLTLLLSPLLALLHALAGSTPAAACALHGSAPSPLRGAEPLPETSSTGDDRAADHPRHLLLHLHTRSLRFGTATTGRARLAEETMLLIGGWDPIPAIGLGLSLPLMQRRIDLPDGSRQSLRGVGDVGLELRWRPTTHSRPNGTHVELMAGALLPTAPLVREQGEYYHPDVQLGAGVVVPRAGILLLVPLRSSLQLLTVSDALWAPPSPDGVQRAAVLRLQSGIAWRPHPMLTLQWTLPLRYEGRTRSEGDIVTSSGGILLSTEPLLRWQLPAGFHLEGGAGIPLWQGLRGGQRERVSLQLGAGLRF